MSASARRHRRTASGFIAVAVALVFRLPQSASETPSLASRQGRRVQMRIGSSWRRRPSLPASTLAGRSGEARRPVLRRILCLAVSAGLLIVTPPSVTTAHADATSFVLDSPAYGPNSVITISFGNLTVSPCNTSFGTTVSDIYIV